MPDTISATMTSRERIFAALTMSELPDQVPVVPLLMTRGLREGNVTCDVAQVDPEASAMAKITAERKFGGDVVICGTDLFTPVENLGAELDYLPYAQPSLVTHPVSDRESWNRLRDEYYDRGFDPEAGRLRTIQQECQIFIREGYKESHAIVTPVGGPITTAQLVIGSSEFLQLLAEDPEWAHEIIELSLDCVKNICDMMYEAGMDACNILDPFNSSDILPPELYREFGLPYQKRLFQHINDSGNVAFTHTCTYTQPIWRDIADNGCINFNGDMYPGMDKAKQVIGGEISLMGTLSPHTTLVHGSPDDIRMEVRKLAAEVGYNGGFVLMPGCDIDWTVPEENMFAMINACAEIKYPMDIQALGDLSEVPLPGYPNHPATRAISTEGDENVAKARTQSFTAEEEVYAKLVEAIETYDGDLAIEWTNIGLERGLSAQQIVFEGLSLGMKIVGDMYERNERFVTDMLKAAKTMDQAMPILEPLLVSGAEGGDGDGGGDDGVSSQTVVVGLVRGNTQDIGKNLVCLMLKANGFNVIDLGKNVKPEQFVDTAVEHDAVAIGMSIMTNSSNVYVEKCLEVLNERGLEDRFTVLIGGAATNRGIARNLGVEYGSDANAAVSIVKAAAA